MRAVVVSEIICKTLQVNTMKKGMHNTCLLSNFLSRKATSMDVEPLMHGRRRLNRLPACLALEEWADSKISINDNFEARYREGPIQKVNHDMKDVQTGSIDGIPSKVLNVYQHRLTSFYIHAYTSRGWQGRNCIKEKGSSLSARKITIFPDFFGDLPLTLSLSM